MLKDILFWNAGANEYKMRATIDNLPSDKVTILDGDQVKFTVKNNETNVGVLFGKCYEGKISIPGPGVPMGKAPRGLYRLEYCLWRDNAEYGETAEVDKPVMIGDPFVVKYKISRRLMEGMEGIYLEMKLEERDHRIGRKDIYYRIEKDAAQIQDIKYRLPFYQENEGIFFIPRAEKEEFKLYSEIPGQYRFVPV